MKKIKRRCKNCKFQQFIWKDRFRCKCAVTWQWIYINDPFYFLKGIFCKWFKAKEDNIDL